MHVALLVPDGVGARNFLLGPFPAATRAAGSLTVLHAIPPSSLDGLAGRLGPQVAWEPLVPSGDGRLLTTLRNALGYAHMYWAGSYAMRRRLARPIAASTIGRRALLVTARLAGRAAASRRGIAALDRWHCRVAQSQAAVAHYRRFFRETQPDVLFCTHQRPAEIVAPVLAARSLGIPTATFIFSWDNLSSKGRIAAPFDHYLVWSEHMRNELLHYYPDIAPARVAVVGTPQFEPYTDPSLQSTREDFCREIGADPTRPLICFSGGDRGTCPDDAGHVGIVLELIRTGAIVGQPRVLLRPAPVDRGERYAEVRARYPELIYAPPAWHHSADTAWSRVMPTAEDVRFLANLTRYSTLNINTASTMTLDFAIHDRPVVNLAFDVTSPPPLGAPLELYYRYEHYRPVLELTAARVARSAGELATFVNRYLEDPTLDREGRRRLVELEVGHTVAGASARIVAVLKSLAAAPRPTVRARSSTASRSLRARRGREGAGWEIET
jgi:hypothetical protein